MKEDVRLAIRAATYWMNNTIAVAPTDTFTTLPCGHIGIIGAPLCDECTKSLLKRLCEKIKEDDK